MDRLRCGAIFTEAFAAYLRGWWLAEPAKHAKFFPSVEYVSFKEGPRAGEQWFTLYWHPRHGVENYELFEIGPVTLHLSRQAQKALKWRCLDAAEGSVVVRGGETK